MVERLKDSLNYALVVAMAGAIVGGIAGWVGHLSEDGPGPIADIEVKIFWLVALAVPLVVAFIGRLDREEHPDSYESLADALPVTLVMGVLGAIGASALFFIVGVNVPGIFGGEDGVDLNLALRERLWLGPFAGVIIISIVGSVLVTWWLVKTTREAPLSG